MKITEIRNKLFKLSDLNGLIKENTFDEGRPAANAPSLKKFFELHPEYIGIPYQNPTEIGNALRAALHDYFKDTATPYPSPEEYAVMSNAARKIYALRIKQANYILAGTRSIANKAVSIPGISSDDKVTTLSKAPLEHLRDFFSNNGGSNFSFSEEILYNPEQLEKYVDGLKTLALNAGNFFLDSGVKITSFNDAGIQVGNEEDPFALFLLFYYQNFCETRGGWNGRKTDLYLKNIQNPNVREYVKYTLNITPNVFKLIIGCVKNSINTLSEKIISEGFGGNELLMARSMAYLKRYNEEYPGLFSGGFLNKIISFFEISSQNVLFDPIEVIPENVIKNGILKWCERSSDEAIKELVRPVLNGDIDKCSPIERIFLTAQSIDGLLQANYKKYGEGPNKSKMTVGLLLEDAERGIDYWNSLSRGGRIPKPQVKLRTIYNIEREKKPELESIPFWRILNFDNEVKDKTQTDIFYFLIGNSSKDVKWTYEYNRSKKTDTDLVGKSIDILGQTNSNTFCFEYQGEQHYRPISVTYNEYAEFPFFTRMREYILTECGFIQKTVGGTKFFSGPENSNAERMSEIKKIIIGAYKKFSGELSKSMAGEFNISSRLNEAFSELGKINKKSKFENDAQLLSYFQRVLEESTTSDVFETPPMEDVVPYLGSPRRFLDEVKTAQDMGRDIEKREIIRRKEKLGWVLSYIIPRGATDDEKKYTEELAGNENLVFQWNNEGKEKLLGFMQQNKILADGILEENTLFREIINELFNDFE